MIDRRKFGSAVLVGLAACRPALAQTQQTSAPPSVGFIALATREAAFIDAFLAGLAEQGRTPGRHVRVVEVYGDGSQDKVRDTVKDLLASGTRIFVTAGVNAARMINAMSSEAAIVVASLESLQAAGVAGTIARPDGNVTGFATLQSELIEKRLELLRDLAPDVRRVAFVTNPGNANHPATLGASRNAAARLKLDVRPVEIKRRDEVGRVLGEARVAGAEAALFMRDFLFESIRQEIVDAANAARLISIFDEAAYVRLGGMMSYSTSRPDLFRRSAAYVVKILDGAHPRDLPIQQPTKFELTVNAAAARAFGLTLPPSILLRADEVLE